MNTRTKIAAISLSVVALVGAVGVGISYADDPTTTPSPSATPTSNASPGQPHNKQGDQQKKQGEHAKRALLKRALHGEVTLGGKKTTRVIDFQRGNVQQVSATSITVKSTDGFTATYVVTGDTRIRQADEVGKLADVKTGDKVRVVAVKDGKTNVAKAIAEPKG